MKFAHEEDLCLQVAACIQKLREGTSYAHAKLGMSAALVGRDVSFMLRVAHRLKVVGDVELAEDAFREVCERDPASIEAFVEIGILARDRGAFEQAEACFRTATELSGTRFTWPWIHLAGEQRRVGQLQQALDTLQLALTVDSRHLHALLEAGAVARSLGFSEQALAHFEKAVEYHPENPRARTYYGQQLRLANHWTAAEHEFQVAARLAPKDPAPVVELGMIARHLGKADEAKQHFLTAIALAPQLFWPHVHYAVELRRAGKYGDSLRELDRALEIEPSNPFALLEAGITEKLMGRADDALMHFEKAYHLGPAQFLFGLHFGSALRAAARYGESFSVFEDMIRSNIGEPGRARFEQLWTSYLACPGSAPLRQIYRVDEERISGSS